MNRFSGLPHRSGQGKIIRNMVAYPLQELQRQGQMQAVQPAQFFYRCQFVSVLRKSPQPTRAAQAFAQCLLDAHG